MAKMTIRKNNEEDFIPTSCWLGAGVPRLCSSQLSRPCFLCYAVADLLRYLNMDDLEADVVLEAHYEEESGDEAA